MSHEEVEIETIAGLPGELPEGEHVIWQGRPAWKPLARRAFGVRWIGAYLAVFAGVRLVVSLQGGEGVVGVGKFLAAVVLSLACLAVLSLLAWLHARATIYTITNRRVVLRLGVAFPMTWNLPFRQLASADLAVRSEGDGDIVLQVTQPNSLAWILLWPHVAPWPVVRARPALRALAEPRHVSTLLTEAVRTWAAAEAAPVVLGAPMEPAMAAPASSVPGVATEVGC